MIVCEGLIAMFVIGGMDGVEDEAQQFSDRWNGRKPIYVLTETGAAAEIIGQKHLPGKVVVDQTYFERVLPTDALERISKVKSKWGTLTDFLVERLASDAWREDL